MSAKSLINDFKCKKGEKCISPECEAEVFQAILDDPSVIVTEDNGSSSKSILEADGRVENVFVGNAETRTILNGSTSRPTIMLSDLNEYDNGWADYGSETKTAKEFEFLATMSSTYLLGGFTFESGVNNVTVIVTAKHVMSDRELNIDMDAHTVQQGTNTVRFNSRALMTANDTIAFKATFSKEVNLVGWTGHNVVLPEKYGETIFTPKFKNIMEDVYFENVVMSNEFSDLERRVAALEAK